MTKNKDKKRECRFREEVKRLLIDNYGTEVSESEMKIIESKLIEHAAKGNYDIYVPVACYDCLEDFKMTSEDLLRFVRKPGAKINIEKLRLYTMANDTFRNIYYEVREPDEYGILHDYPEVLKTHSITTGMFRINEEDIPFLTEKIKNGNLLDLKVKRGEGKVLAQYQQKKPKTKNKKLRGVKLHSIPPKDMNEIIKEMMEGYPKKSNSFIAKKAMVEIENKYRKKPDGEPLYQECTLTRKVSEFRNKKKRKKAVG